MHKNPRFPVANRAGDMLSGEGGREGHVTAGERLAKAHDVGADASPVTGKQLAGATKPGGNLVGNQQQAELVAQSAYPLQIAGVVEAHAARSLHYGLEDDGCDLFMMVSDERGEIHHTLFVPLGVETAAGGRGEVVLGQEALVELVHAAIRVTNAHGTEGVAVIAAAQCDELGSGGAFGVPVLLGHLERHFHRYRSRVGQKHPVQTGRCDLHQLATQLDRRGMGQAAKHDMGHLAELGGGGRVEFRHLIAVDTGPPGAHAIHQFATIGESDGDSFGAGHFIAGQGMGKRGIGVPDVVQVEFLVGHFMFCCQLV